MAGIRQLFEKLFASYYGDLALLNPDQGQWGTIVELPSGMDPTEALTVFQRSAGDNCQRVFSVYSGIISGVGEPVGLAIWGAGGMLQAEFDIVQGTIIRIVGVSVGLRAFNEAPNVGGPVIVSVTANAGIGMAGGGGSDIAPRRTRKVASPGGGAFVDFPVGTLGKFIVPFARNFQVIVDDPTTTYDVRALDHALNPIFTFPVAAGAFPPVLPVTSDISKVQVASAAACNARCLFGLQL
jgi:hypothetical protein